MHAQRLTLWDNFNNCWLALLQRQLDDTQTMLDSGRSPIPPRSLLPLATLEKMGDELVAHCDELGKFGLVDYQMGVAEEEIIDSRFSRVKGDINYESFLTWKQCLIAALICSDPLAVKIMSLKIALAQTTHLKGGPSDKNQDQNAPLQKTSSGDEFEHSVLTPFRRRLFTSRYSFYNDNHASSDPGGHTYFLHTSTHLDLWAIWLDELDQ